MFSPRHFDAVIPPRGIRGGQHRVRREGAYCAAGGGLTRCSGRNPCGVGLASRRDPSNRAKNGQPPVDSGKARPSIPRLGHTLCFSDYTRHDWVPRVNEASTSEPMFRGEDVLCFPFSGPLRCSPPPKRRRVSDNLAAKICPGTVVRPCSGMV